MLLKKVKIKENIKLDFFHLEETSINNEDIFNNTKYVPKLNNDSRFLVTFDELNIISRGIADVALGYTFSVYREAKDTNQLVYIAKLEEGALSVIDYNVSNDSSYKYYIFKEDEDKISEAVISNEIKTCWWDWSIIDLVPSADDKEVYYALPNTMWKFNLNISSSSKTQTVNNTTYNNLTKFPKVSHGKSNYSSGSLTCLLGDIRKSSSNSIEYVEKASLLDDWNKFCANGNIKLLKDRKGNALLVCITGTSSQTDDVTREQANSITFSWVQVQDNTNITIIGG